MKKVKFNIQGMTCSSCSSHVDKAVNQLNGVKNVSVNLLSNNMTLEYDENIITPEAIIKAVENAGYGATLVSHEKDKNESKKLDNSSNIKEMKKRVIYSFAFLIALMFVSMHQMIFEFLKIETPAFFKQYLHGNENVITDAFIQLLLLLPILYLNRNYFITGFKRLLKLSPNMDSLIAMRKWCRYFIRYICYF